MKITLDTHSAVNTLLECTNSGFSRNGARALVEHLEQLEQELGHEIELDVVAIRCDYSEFSTAIEAAGEYGWTRDDEDYTEEGALEWLREHTEVVEFAGGVIVSNF
jgi:hypothetical protein